MRFFEFFCPALGDCPPAVLLVVVLLNCELRVLRGTKQVGMALSEDGRFCVANYFPAGNMMGSFKENVLPRGTEYKPKKDPARYDPLFIAIYYQLLVAVPKVRINMPSMRATTRTTTTTIRGMSGDMPP